MRDRAKKVAGDALVAASGAVEGAEAVAQRSGLTNKNGEVSEIKAVKAALTPRKSGRRVLDAAADEIRAQKRDDAER